MDEPIRILHVFSEMNRGGAESMIMNIYRNIDRSRVQFDFIVHTAEEAFFDEEIKGLGGAIFRLPRYLGRNHFTYINAWKNFFSESHKHLIVHGHVRSTASIYLKIAKGFGRIAISHSHSTSAGRGLAAVAKTALQSRIRYVADYMFACSLKAGIWLYGKQAVDSDKFIIFNNAIEVEQYIYNVQTRQNVREQFGFTEKVVIGHVGNFTSPKNHLFLIDVLKVFQLKVQNAVLLLVGSGPLLEKVRSKVEHEGLADSVVFAGVRSDVPDLLQAMDIFVFPSLYEGLPMAVVEAQASGLPVLLADTIATEVKLTNIATFLPLNTGAEEWAKKISDVMRDVDRRQYNSTVKDAGYDAQENAKWLMEFYESLVTEAN